MRKTTAGEWIYLVVSLLSPLLYLLMYLPVWNGKEFHLYGDLPYPIILFVFQCLVLAFSAAQLGLHLFKKDSPLIFSVISALLTTLSIVLLCFVGYFFVLELLNIPWFPQQR